MDAQYDKEQVIGFMEQLNLIILLLTASVGAYLFFSSRVRTAKDVIADLSPEEFESKSDIQEEEITDKKTLYKKELQKMGLFDKASIKSFELKVKLAPIAFILLGLSLRLFAGGTSVASLVFVVLIFFAIGVFYTSSMKKKYIDTYQYRINFYLPLIMERLVMAVQAGQDVLPAIGIIVDVEKSGKKLDPICELLSKVKRLTESGLSFEKSLHQVAESVDSGSLRHAFIHLALAYKDGGELILPLRELSDSTQIFYQETIEEEIAKMPVKATMPLLLTFAGLIICFLTSPIIQILDVMANAVPK